MKLFCLLALAPLYAQTPGAITGRVACRASPKHSYALYLPPQYTPDRAWPILYCFDPGARGRRPVERFEQAAAAYGYIVAGSNDSRNGPWEGSLQSVGAMWNDTNERFRIDENRLYVAGFSGGARVATLIATQTKLAGVIACSGGFPSSETPKSVSFPFFGTAGTEDFNYREMKQIDSALAAQHARHRLAIFDGGHEWLPAPLAMEALAWMELEAMRAGRRPKDPALIERLFQKRDAALRDAKPGDAYLGYVSLAADFDGLADVAEPTRKAAELKESAAVRQSLKAEREADRLEEEWQQQVAQVAAMLRRKADREEDTPERRAARRVIGGAFIGAMEEGRALLAKGDYAEAVRRLETATTLRPQAAAPQFELARAYAMAGNRKKAREALDSAIAKGFNDTARIDKLRQEVESGKQKR